MGKCTIGLDFGTNSARALLVDVQSGEELASSVYEYAQGRDGVVLDDADDYLARQHPIDYLNALERLVPELLGKACSIRGFERENVIGVGVDTTASTPVPVDESGRPLALLKEFKGNKNALAWLWKDHTASAEAESFVHTVASGSLHYLSHYGGVYSSEWFWSKLLHCAKTDRRVADAAFTWVEQSDLIPAVLAGIDDARLIPRNSCAAGYKMMYLESEGGYPPEEFFQGFDADLARIRRTLPARVSSPGARAGLLCERYRKLWGLRAGLPVSCGIIDAHSGAIGAGIRPGVLVKIIGTSTCDLALLKPARGIRAIPGISGVVRDGILPGFYGVEAGQAAVGDILNWYTSSLAASGGGKVDEDLHALLTKGADRFRAGETGLLALDWHNGNRNVLMDPLLSGVIMGLTLGTGPEEIYRSCIEATGFGARTIIERLREHSVPVEEIVCCGGIAEKNDLFMQIYADILGAPMKLARSPQAPALGAAICGAVAAGKASGGYDDFSEAISRMTGEGKKSFIPRPEELRVYDELYSLYSELHDSFGTRSGNGDLFQLMKRLIEIKKRVSSG